MTALARSRWSTAAWRALVVAALALSTVSLLRPPPAPATALPPALQTEIEGLLRNLVAQDPNIVVDALRVAQERAAAERVAAQRANAESIVRRHAAALHDDPAAPAIGDPDAPITLVEFLDYQCGFCRHAHPGLEQLLADNPDVRVVTKQIPILGPASLYAARAAIAADRLGAFPAFHDALMEARVRLNEDTILRLAERSGIDRAALLAEMAAGQHTDQRALTRNGELARNLGITGTPAFVIGDTVLRGLPDMATLQDLVEAARQPG